MKMFNQIQWQVLVSLFATFLVSSATAQKDLPTFDDEFTCTSQTVAQKYVGDYNVDISSFGGMELCNPAIDTKKLFNDLSLVEAGQFRGDGSNPLIRGFVNINDYYGWLKSMTRGMDRGNDIPWATAYNSGGYFTMQDGWSKLSTLGRVGTVVHEARHTAGYYHMACTTGPYAGTNLAGCDRDYSYGGSHAIEMEYYARVAIYGANFHPAYKYMARLMAMGRTNFVFNTKPIAPREALMLVTAQNEVMLWDGKSLVQRDGNVLQRRLKRTSFGASLFDFTKAFAIDPYGRSMTNKDVNDDYSYFKLLADSRGQGPEPLMDMEEIDLGIKRNFVLLNRGGQLGRYVFREGKWSSFSNGPRGAELFSQHNPAGEKGLFVRSVDRKIYQLNPENLSQATQLSTTWPQTLVSVVKDRETTLHLYENGLLLTAGTDLPFFPTKEINIRQAVNIPLYDAFEVKP